VKNICALVRLVYVRYTAWHRKGLSVRHCCAAGTAAGGICLPPLPPISLVLVATVTKAQNWTGNIRNHWKNKVRRTERLHLSRDAVLRLQNVARHDISWFRRIFIQWATPLKRGALTVSSTNAWRAKGSWTQTSACGLLAELSTPVNVAGWV
jgi:hypothetical protein